MSSDDDGDDDGDGKVLNQTEMNDFFSTKRKRGRPRKKANTAYDILPEPELKKQNKKKSKTEALFVASKVIEKEKMTRTNWSKGDNERRWIRPSKIG